MPSFLIKVTAADDGAWGISEVSSQTCYLGA